MFINISNLVNNANTIVGSTAAETSALSKLQALLLKNDGYTVVGTGATLPVASLQNFSHMYYDTDTQTIFVSNGKNWKPVTLTDFIAPQPEPEPEIP